MKSDEVRLKLLELVFDNSPEWANVEAIIERARTLEEYVTARTSQPMAPDDARHERLALAVRDNRKAPVNRDN